MENHKNSTNAENVEILSPALMNSKLILKVNISPIDPARISQSNQRKISVLGTMNVASAMKHWKKAHGNAGTVEL